MANQSLFQTPVERQSDLKMTINEAGGLAYAFEHRHALAQYAATGCLCQTFYASAEEQLDYVLQLANCLDDDFVARTAVYSRTRGFMKDMPALLCAVLAARQSAVLDAIFPVVIDNARMLRTFVQIVRSGKTGRRSFGSSVRRLIRQWFAQRTDKQLFNSSVGANPSMADIIRMVHPRPENPQREALFGYFLDREYDSEALPEFVREYLAFCKDMIHSNGMTCHTIPDVPFQLLSALPLGKQQWTEIARNAPWQTTRMNLNTFARHGVLENPELVTLIADRLRDGDAIRRSRVFPYQLMTAFLNADSTMPKTITDALQDAMEIAVSNVPCLSDRGIAVCVDVSFSMSATVTGCRRGRGSAIRYVDVASLIASSVLRVNKHAEIVPFCSYVHDICLEPQDTIMANAQRLAALCEGGTDCSCALAHLNEQAFQGDVVIYVSDNESWLGSDNRNCQTQTMEEWERFRTRNPNARLVNIDLAPYGTTQTLNRTDIANVGGFSDVVFDFLAAFVQSDHPNHWVDVINATAIPTTV